MTLSASDQIEFTSRFALAIRQGKRVEAIKCHRILTGEDLPTALKYITDNWAKLRREHCS